MSQPQPQGPAPSPQTKLVAGFVQGQIQRLDSKLDALMEKVEATAKAVGGLPDRWTDRLLMKSVKSRHSWAHLLLYTLFCVVAGAFIQAWVLS